jgi:hypothetical protein
MEMLFAKSQTFSSSRLTPSLHYNFLFIQKALVRSDKEERKIIQAAASVNFLI